MRKWYVLLLLISATHLSGCAMINNGGGEIGGWVFLAGLFMLGVSLWAIGGPRRILFFGGQEIYRGFGKNGGQTTVFEKTGKNRGQTTVFEKAVKNRGQTTVFERE